MNGMPAFNTNRAVSTFWIADLMIAPHVEAKVMPQTIEHLILHADAIFLGKVISTDSPASVRVLESWKGPDTSIYKIDASKAWTCDVSYVERNETAVFLLSGDRIIFSGRGRMPIVRIKNKDYVVMDEEIHWLGGMVALRRQNPDYDFQYKDDLTTLSDLKALIKKVLKEKPQKK